MSEPVKALFVGLNTVDLQFFVEGFPKANTKTKAHRNEIAAGGPATNAAITCAFLGVNTTLITPIGNHSLTRFITDDIVKHSIRLIDPIHEIDSKPVFASIITDEINGERTVFSYHPERKSDLLLNELKLDDLNSFKIALFDGFYPELSVTIAKELKKHNVTTVLDGGSWKPGLENLLSYIDIAVCSNDFTAPFSKSRTETVKRLLNFGINKVAITCGGNPIQIYENNEQSEINVPAIEAIDTLGAGDIFHGAFCYFYALHDEYKTALKNASVVAANSCKHRGTRSWMKKYTPQTIQHA